jgi:hypothetical protein
MKNFGLFFRFSAVLALSFSMLACGGGGDVAGDTEEFFTSPSEFKWTVSSCSNSGGNQTIFTIVGGTPPYRIHNSLPRYLSVDRVEVSGKDPKFKVTTLGGCLDPGTITVLDYHSRSTVVEITVEVEEAVVAQ